MLTNFTLTLNSIEQFIHNCHKEWFGTIESGLEKELHLNLLVVDKSPDSKVRLIDCWLLSSLALHPLI